MATTIGVIGTGYVGLVSGTCFAETGATVYCVDVDAEKIERLKQGILPIYEPGLESILERNIRENRIFFTTSLEEAVLNCNVLFLCLPTPPNEDGSADLKYVLQVTAEIATIVKTNNLQSEKIVVTRSTVPVGTADKVRALLTELAPGFPLYNSSNPEFLREGFAVKDTMEPDRVVIGTSNDYVSHILQDIYEPFVSANGNPIFIMDEKSAEITKYAANSFLALKISFMNELSAYCEAVGVDIDQVRMGIGADARIGKKFIYAGLGYGGSCFPKDVKALIHSTKEAGTPLSIIEAVESVNHKQTQRFIQRIITRFNGSVKGKHFALWGLAFKPDTDDVRDAPAYIVIQELLNEGATICAYDPEAMENTKKRFGDSIQYGANRYDTCAQADALIIATEWSEFNKPDAHTLKAALKAPIIFDGRNMYDTETMKAQGFEYHSVGRVSVYP